MRKTLVRFIPVLTRILLLVILGVSNTAHLAAQPVTVKITADNFFAVYTGTAATAGTQHFTGSWPSLMTPAPITPAAGNNFLYVAAWDDGSVFQGLLATVAVGAGFVPTGSPLWAVCATNKPLASNTAAAPAPGALTAAIAACNSANSWRPTSNGPNNGNASAAGLWSKVPKIDDTANWIWHDNGSTACAGDNGFLKGGCNPGEYLIFRISLERVRSCLPPVPDFNVDWNAGYGTFVANGTDSQGEVSHFWSIQEADQSWVGKGPEISQWFLNQQAGVFDLKSFFEGKGQRLKCSAYYRVKLVVSNQCVNWSDTIRLVKLKCCPGDVICLDLNKPVISDTAHWTVTEVPNGVPLPAAPFAVPGTSFASTEPNWITAVSSANANGLGGFYTYQYRFCLCPGFSNPTLKFKLCTDNEADVWLNNPNPTGNPSLNKIGSTGPNLVCASLTASSGFTAGTNVLTIRVRNRGVGGNNAQSTPTGLSFNGTLTATQGQCTP